MALHYQDFKQAITDGNQADFIQKAIDDWKSTSIYLTAIQAELYDRNENTMIKSYEKYIFDTKGGKHKDLIAANNQIACNEFNKLLTWTTQYSMANGVNYDEGVKIDDSLGKQIDSETSKAIRLAMRDGVVFIYYDGEKAVPFSPTEFVPLYDENNGDLISGIRFYQVDSEKAMNVWLYEVDGVTQYRTKEKDGKLIEIQPKTAYKLNMKGTQADGITAVKGENYGKLPIIKLQGNMYGVSFLNFVKDKINAYDLVISGYANDIQDNAYLYWIIKNSGGMEAEDLARVKAQLKLTKAAVIDSSDGGDISHVTQDIPVEARNSFLDRIKSEIYSAWMAVDMSQLASGAVNEMQINAMYSNADNRASEIENEIKGFIIQILAFKGIEIYDWQISFVRNKLTSELQKAQINQINISSIMTASVELDSESILNALKNSTDLFANLDIDKIIESKGADIVELTEPTPVQEPIDNSGTLE